MKAKFYTLGEYKIIETDNGALWWESHTGLSAVKRGKCIIRGDILLIGPIEDEEPGFLKREFLDSLQEVPQWDDTRYYCSNYSVHDVQSGRKLTEKEISEWTGKQKIHQRYSNGLQGVSRKEGQTEETRSVPVTSYRLGQYEIIKEKNGQVGWKTYPGSGSLWKGKGIIAGDILFMETGATEEPGDSEHTFLKHLNQLPEWKTTRFYCPGCVLIPCGPGKYPVREKARGSYGKTPLIFTRGIFTPPAKKTPPSPEWKKIWRIPLIDSSLLSFLKQTAVKAGKGVERKLHGAALKNKPERESKITKSCPKALKNAAIHVYRFKIWIICIGALILIIGSLLLALLHGHWNNLGGDHHHRDHSSAHHRDH